jgi:hypothetical protein
MTAMDDIAPLIPWYATGTLAPQESAQVEEHLASCDECRNLLAVARGFRRLGPQVKYETLFDHVQSQRLVEFAADPASLEPDARRFITDHIRACAVCAEALEILEDMSRVPVTSDDGGAREAAAHPPGRTLRQTWQEIWRRLSRTLLHPAPALAYLVALVTFLAVLPLRQPAPGTGLAPLAQPTGTPRPAAPPVPGVAILPPAVDLPGETVFRGQGKPPDPLVVPYRVGTQAVAIALVADVEDDVLQDPAAAFHVEIVQGDRVVLADSRPGTDLDKSGRLTILLDPAALEPGVPCRARLLLAKPGDPRDGEEIYRRTFLLSPTSR